MRFDRRSFIGTAVAGGAAAAFTARAQHRDARKGALNEDYEKLDEILRQPVFKREFFSSPVIIKSVELLEYEGRFICRVRSTDGAEGISVSHASMRTLYPIFLHKLVPFFEGKDARDIDVLMDKVFIYSLNFRLSGQALGIPLATLEFALLDMLGRIASKSMGELIGQIHNPKVAVYQATEYRELPVHESVELIKRDVAEYNAHAVKIKVGGLMFMTRDMHAKGPEGRTEEIVPLIRETFGDDMTLYADANGFYSMDEAIRVGRLLEKYNYGFFEEPVPFDWYEETKKVSDELSMKVAGGEQEYSIHGFRWLVANDGVQIVQPDTYYFGGMIRSMQVARMAHAFGKECTPHMSGGHLGYLYMIHFVSAIPNAQPHHEFKGLGTHVPFNCPTSPLQVEDGKIQVPTGPGLGIEIDPQWVAKHRVVEDA